MKVILTRRNPRSNAVGDFCLETNELTVNTDSIVSDEIHRTKKNRWVSTIEKNRKECVIDRKTVKDIYFRSASTAANFVTGGSTNRLVAWKTEKGKTLREYLSE